MSTEQRATEIARRSSAGRALRALAVLAAAAFVALMVYGVLARAPDRTIDDALAGAEAVDAPLSSLRFYSAVESRSGWWEWWIVPPPTGASG